MIISANSHIRNPSIYLEPKQVLIFNGIQYSVDVCDIAYERLKNNLHNLAFSEGNLKTSFPEVFSDIWMIINNATIFYNILTLHFGISKEDMIFDKIRGIEFLRHSYQHIEERINEILYDKEMPIYGTLSWYAQKEPDSDGGKICMIQPGSITHKQMSEMKGINPVGRKNDKTINDIEFSMIIKINKNFELKTIKLNELMNGLEEVIAKIEDQLRDQFKNLPSDKRHVNDLQLNVVITKIK